MFTCQRFDTTMRPLDGFVAADRPAAVPPNTDVGAGTALEPDDRDTR